MTYKQSKRTNIWRRVGLSLLMLIALSMSNARPALTKAEAPQNEQAITQALANDGQIRIIVALKAPDSANFRAQSQQVIRAQAQQVLESLPEAEFQLVHRYQTTAGLVGVATPKGLERLRRNSEVQAIALDMSVYPVTLESAAVIHADKVWRDFGLTGAGVNIAVLDSGIDLNHPDLADQVVAQHCFTSGTCPPDDTDEGNSAQDENGHGTHVAGIIAGQGTSSPKGIAPDASIVAVRVMDKYGRGWTSDIIAAIDWVVANQARLQVKLINISLGGDLYQGICDTQDANTILYAETIAAARSVGITVFAAAGNQAQSDALTAPACIADVIAVGSTYDANLGSRSWNVCTDKSTNVDRITCFSNSGEALDLLAPGAWINSTALGGGQSGDAGTSMAAPHAVGVAALMLQSRPGLSPAAIETTLKETGVSVTDARNGRTTPRVDALAAVRAIMPQSSTIISGTALLQGRTHHEGITITLDTISCDANVTRTVSTLSTTVQTSTDNKGRFTFTLDLEHPYRCLHVAHEGYLDGLSPLPMTSDRSLILPGGDVVKNNVINIFDLARLASRLGKQDTTADLNDDGVVNILDLTMAAGNYNRQGPVSNWK